MKKSEESQEVRSRKRREQAKIRARQRDREAERQRGRENCLMRRRPENGDEMHDGYGSRGGGSGGGYYSAPTDRIRETNHNIMEMQNNAHIDDLSDQVSSFSIPVTPDSFISRIEGASASVSATHPSEQKSVIFLFLLLCRSLIGLRRIKAGSVTSCGRFTSPQAAPLCCHVTCYPMFRSASSGSE